MQNLETIVTSEAWDALQDPTTDAASIPEASDPVELEPPSGQRASSADAEEQAENLVPRLRT